MNVNDFRHLFAYSHWATELQLDAAARLTDEQWTRDLGSSFPSVRATLTHILGAELLWLRRWQGTSPAALPEWMDNATAAGLRTVHAEVHEERERFLATLGDGDLGRVVHFTFLSGLAGAQPLEQLMMHAANHSTYHRGQITTLLRQLGATPPPIDLFGFNRLRAEAAV